jgi:hypothetical protein
MFAISFGYILSKFRICAVVASSIPHDNPRRKAT